MTNLDIIMVEQFMRFREMFTQKTEEFFADICWNTTIKWWIQSYSLFFFFFRDYLLVWMYFAIFEM